MNNLICVCSRLQCGCAYNGIICEIIMVCRIFTPARSGGAIWRYRNPLPKCSANSTCLTVIVQRLLLPPCERPYSAIPRKQIPKALLRLMFLARVFGKIGAPVDAISMCAVLIFVIVFVFMNSRRTHPERRWSRSKRRSR